MIKGEYIETINFRCEGTNIDYETGLKTIDVTGCPNLVSIDVYRKNRWGESSLNTLYMTAAQAESVSVTKLDKVQIVVK